MEEQKELIEGARQFALLVAHLAELNGAACERTQSCPAARALLSYFTQSKPIVCWLDASLPEGCQDGAAVRAALKDQFETLRRQLNLGLEPRPMSTFDETAAALRESLECWPTLIVLYGVNNQEVLDTHKHMCIGHGHHILLLSPQLQLPADMDMLAIGLDDLLEATFQVRILAATVQPRDILPGQDIQNSTLAMKK